MFYASPCVYVYTRKKKTTECCHLFFPGNCQVGVGSIDKTFYRGISNFILWYRYIWWDCNSWTLIENQNNVFIILMHKSQYRKIPVGWMYIISQYIQCIATMVSPTLRFASVLREAYLFQVWLLAHLVSVCQWGVCGWYLYAQSQPLSVAPWQRGQEASGCGTWDGMFPSYSYPHWSTLSEKPLELALPVPLCIQLVFPHFHMMMGYSSLGRSPTWSLHLRRFWGLKCQASCEGWHRTWMKDEDLAERVLEASLDETLRGSFHPGVDRSAGLVEGEATPSRRADADCSVGEVLQTRCWEGGMAGLCEDTGIQRRRLRRGKCFLCLRAQRERDHRSCSILNCWFL